MKLKQCPELAINIYSHCWYVPLFAFLLGVKLCLISLLADSIHKGEHEQEQQQQQTRRLEEMLEVMEKHIMVMHSAKVNVKSSPKVTTTTMNQEILQDWRTLDNLENAVIEPSSRNRTDPESIWVVFNRIPRCGGETMVELLYSLGEQNGFSHQEHEYRTPWSRFLLEQEQENLVTWFEYQHLPKSYDRHFYFVNFTSYQKFVKEQPIYINIVRDPIERLKSVYKSKRTSPELVRLEVLRRNGLNPSSGQDWLERTFEECVEIQDAECDWMTGQSDFTLMVPFFCGQHPNCVIINDKRAIQRAKFTIEKYYTVIGSLERWNDTLIVLEKYVPRFFKGAHHLFYNNNSNIKRTNTGMDKRRRRLHFQSIVSSKTNQVPNDLRAVLEKKLSGEFELYNFINQRLSLQLAAV